MFDFYSERAKEVLFIARAESRARGAKMLDVDDLLVSLIMEDQGIRSQAMLEIANAPDPSQLPVEPHTAFLPAEVAVKLLAEVQDALPRRQSVPASADLPVSGALSLVLGVANDLQQKFQSKQVTPLHLLAAVLAGSTNGVLSLREAGITQETVIDAIRKSAEPTSGDV
jgi:ATP-dependent Clp protease ATP-binding subunit ClpA